MLAVRTCLGDIVRRLIASGGCAKLCGKTARHHTENGKVLRAWDFVRFRWHFEDAQGTPLSFSAGSAVGRVIELKKEFVKVRYPFPFSGGQGKDKDCLEHPILYFRDKHLCAAENLGDLSTDSWWSYATEAEYAARVNNPIDQDKLCEDEEVGAGSAGDARGPDSTLVGADCPDAGPGPDCSSSGGAGHPDTGFGSSGSDGGGASRSACSSDGGGGGVDSSREWWCCSECNCKVAKVLEATSTDDAETVLLELERANGDANTATAAVLDGRSGSRGKQTKHAPDPGACAICATKKPICATNRDGRRSRRSVPSQDSPERFCPGSLVRVKWRADGKAYDPFGTSIRWKKVAEKYQLDVTEPRLELWHAVVVTDHWKAEQAVSTNKYDVIYRCQCCFDRALSTCNHEAHNPSTCAQCLELNNENDGHEQAHVNVEGTIIDLVRAAPPPSGVLPHRLSSRSAATQHRRSGPSAFVRMGKWLHLDILGEADTTLTTLMDGTAAKLQEISLETVSVALALAAFLPSCLQLYGILRCMALTIICRLVPCNVHSLRQCITCQPTIPRPPSRTAYFPGQRCV
jgi:hypothetical protein